MSIKSPGFDFASRDYENIRRDLLNRASFIAPEWTDRDPSDFGVLMVELWAYMGDVLHYYIDRAAGEAFVTTATQRESLLALANLFDYIPYSRSAATAVVGVSNTSNEAYELPENTIFIGSSDLGNFTFFSREPTTLPAGETTSVFVSEGSVIEEEVLTSAASGAPSQRYVLSKLNAVPTNVQVFVYEDGITPTEWNQVSDIALSSSRSSAYSVSVNAANETQILFGNSLAGRVPPANAKITATYVVTSGLDGNMPPNRITYFRSYQPPNIAIVSSSAATGGSSGESIESIKSSLKATVKSQGRAVTLNDFVDLSLRVTGVYSAVTTFTPSPAGGGSVTIYGLPYIPDYINYAPSTVAVSEDVRERLVKEIQPLAMLGVSVVAAPSITLVPKSITATIFVEESYVAGSVKRAVEDALSLMFDLNEVRFGEDLQIGDIYKTIHDVEGVLYANVSLAGGQPGPTQLIKRGSLILSTSGGITTSV